MVVESYNYLMKAYEKEFITTIELSLCVFLAVASMLLFYGNRQHRSRFYYPYIIYALIEAIQAICNVGMFVWGIYGIARGNSLDSPLSENRSQTLAYCIAITATFICLYSIRTYLFLIVIVQALFYLLKAKRHNGISRNLSTLASENKRLSESRN
jgi:hypothetical protein